VTAIDMTHPALPGAHPTRVRRDRRCEREQVRLLNLLSHNGFGCLFRRGQVAAPTVVCRAKQLGWQLAARGGIDHGDG